MGNLLYVQGDIYINNINQLFIFVYVFYYEHPGKYDEALVHYQEALDASRSLLGNTHPDTLVYICNMGRVLQAQGKRNSRHMISLRCLLLLFVVTGKYDIAIAYYKEDLDASRSILGNTHPDTLASITHMGRVLQSQGDINNANMIRFPVIIPFNIYSNMILLLLFQLENTTRH